MVKYTGINHLAFATSDMDRTLRFWRDLLGLRLVGGLGRPGYRLYLLELSGTDMIVFFEWPDVKPVVEKDHGFPVKGPLIFDHVSLGIESEEDLWTIKDKLEAAGFWVSEVMDHGFIHSIYSFDPNGIPIEFSLSVPRLDLRRIPRMADRQPSATALEGPEPRPDKWPEVIDPTPEEDRAVYPGEGTEFLEREDLLLAPRGEWITRREAELEEEIRDLENRLKDRESALPAHSVRPHQLLLIEELEEKIKEKEQELWSLRSGRSTSAPTPDHS